MWPRCTKSFWTTRCGCAAVPRPVHFTPEECAALRELVRLGAPDWEVLFRLFHEKRAHPLAVLQSREFMALFTKLCEEEYPYTAFADAFHTVRSMLLPALWLMTGEVPEADCYHAICTGYGGLLACPWRQRPPPPRPAHGTRHLHP